MRRLIWVGVVASAFFNAAVAGPLDDTGAQYSRVNRESVLQEPRAHARLAELFPPCRDAGADYAEIVALFRAGAERGDARAQLNLGNAYFFGSGVAKDDAEAVKWYRRAARQGEAGAQQNLGYMYENGKGVPQDAAQAFLWLSLAARASSSGRDGGAEVNRVALDRSLANVAARLSADQRADVELGLALFDDYPAHH